jgi:hypothetical protein
LPSAGVRRQAPGRATFLRAPIAQCQQTRCFTRFPTSAQAFDHLFRSLTTLRQLIQNSDDLIDSIPLLAKSR